MDAFSLLAKTDEEQIEAIVAGSLGLGFIVIAIGLKIMTCWIAFKAAESIPPQHREIEPGLVWLLFIPCLPLIWNFFVFPKISNGFRRYFQDNDIYAHDDCAGGLALWYCLCGVFAMIPYLGALSALAGLIILIILLVQFRTLTRHAEALTARMAPRFASPLPVSQFPPKKSDPTNPYA